MNESPSPTKAGAHDWYSTGLGVEPSTWRMGRDRGCWQMCRVNSSFSHCNGRYVARCPLTRVRIIFVVTAQQTSLLVTKIVLVAQQGDHGSQDVWCVDDVDILLERQGTNQAGAKTLTTKFENQRKWVEQSGHPRTFRVFGWSRSTNAAPIPRTAPYSPSYYCNILSLTSIDYNCDGSMKNFLFHLQAWCKRYRLLNWEACWLCRVNFLLMVERRRERCCPTRCCLVPMTHRSANQIVDAFIFLAGINKMESTPDDFSLIGTTPLQESYVVVWIGGSVTMSLFVINFSAL
jgi:hypothetical protein